MMRSLFKNRHRASPKGSSQLVQPEVPALRGAEIAAAFYDHRVGGDFYDFQRVSPDRVLFGLLDVAGRRQDNQKILSAAQATFRAMGCKLFAGGDINEADSMIELCIELNRTVMRAEAGVRSCPAFVGCYNEALATVCYTNAGHTPGLVRDDSGISLLAATGLPLGLFSHATPDAQMVALAPGAALLLVSRGIVEGQCRGEEFGLARVKDNLQRGDHLSAKELGTRVLASVQEFMCRPPTDNDVTTLALTRASATVEVGPSDSSAEKAEIG